MHVALEDAANYGGMAIRSRNGEAVAPVLSFDFFGSTDINELRSCLCV